MIFLVVGLVMDLVLLLVDYYGVVLFVIVGYVVNIEMFFDCMCV